MKDEDFLERASKLSRGESADSTSSETSSPPFQEDLFTGIPPHRRKRHKNDSGFFQFISRMVFYFVCVVLAVTGIGGACAFLGLYFLSADLPNHNSLKNYSPALASRVFLQDGSKLCEYYDEKRYFVPIDLIPEKLVQAFLSAEDKHFYQHKGIDFVGVLRSLMINLKNFKSGKRPQGASTISQQVARIFLIKNNEISYIRKIKEAILAYRTENALTKKQILELYLNQIYLGLGTYGVAAAAKSYFDKTMDELTIAECVYLAGLAKGANNYHPINHRDKAIVRRNWVLSRMLEDGYITQGEHDRAEKEDLKTVPQADGGYKAEFFAEEVRKHVMNMYPSESLNKKGLVIRATLNPDLQKCAYNALKKGLESVDRRFGWRGPLANISVSKTKSKILESLREVTTPKGAEIFQKAVLISNDGKIISDDGSIGKISPQDMEWAKKIRRGDVVLVEKEIRNDKKNPKTVYNIRQLPEVQGAVVVIDVQSGRVLAMQGGYSFAQSEFNRATQAQRQVGSAFKPFVYLAGLENGFSPNTIIDASPVEIDLGPGLGVWKPQNYKGAVLDQITFRRAIERSVNTATIRIAKEVGMNKIARIAEQFGLFESMPEYFSYAIGAGETSLLNITTAYAMLANGGKKISPTLIDYISDKNGNLLFKADKRSTTSDDDGPPRLNDPRPQILSEQSIYQITSLLEGVMQRGSGASAAFLKFPMAGKTGTSNDSRDTWFVGYTPDIAIGVFVGFDDHTKSLGEKATGSNTALPIFINFMKEAKKYLTPKPFRIPKGIKLRKIDMDTGGAPTGKKTILEAFKQEDENMNTENVFKNPLDEAEANAEESSEQDFNGEAQPVFGIY